MAIPALANRDSNKFYNEDGTEMSAEEMKEAIKVDAPILIELFTTSDCIACIYADRLLYDTMKDKKNVIGLSCHLRDVDALRKPGAEEQEKFLTPEGSERPIDPCAFRQWAYIPNRSNMMTEMTIPLFVFNGKRFSVMDPGRFARTLRILGFSTRNKTLEAMVRWKDADSLTISLPGSAKFKKEGGGAGIWIIRYKDMAVEKIESGVNKGKVLRFSNIVQSIKHVGRWHGDERTIDVNVEKPQGGKERGGYVVVVQTTVGSEVLVAGKIEDYPLPNDIRPREAPVKSTPHSIERKDNPPSTKAAPDLPAAAQ